MCVLLEKQVRSGAPKWKKMWLNYQPAHWCALRVARVSQRGQINGSKPLGVGLIVGNPPSTTDVQSSIYIASRV